MRVFDRPNRWKWRLVPAIAVLLSLAACGRVAPTFAPGDITVTSTPPGAAIFIDGQDTGEITPHTFAGLEADLYNISVRLPDHVSTPGVVPVDLSPLDDVTLEFALSETGLLITSQPSGAAISINGNDTGEVTPATIAGLEAGPTDISLSLDTYVVSPASYTVDVIADSVLALPPETFSLRSQRTVVVEGFANTNCGPCPQLAANLLAMVAKPEFTPDRVLYLEFSVNWPNPVDPLFQYNPTENTDRFTEYLVLGAPSLYANGVKLPDALNASAMEDAVLADLQTDPGFLIDVTADFTSTQIPVTVTLDPARDQDLAGYSLFVALYEKVIDFDERGLPVGTNGQVVFHHVFRDRIDTPLALGILTNGTPQAHNLTLSRGDWPLDNLVVIAMVQHDTSHAIVQVGSYGETTETGGTP